MTNREAVSRLENTLRLNNKDDHRSRRYLLALLRSSSKTLISQKMLERTLSLELNLFSELSCLEFEEIDVVKCPLIEFKRCSTLMRSKCKLPELVFSRLGASIKNVTALDGNYQFTFLDASQYARNKRRQHSIAGETYIYLGSDMHLYIPEENIYSLDLSILTTKPEEIENCSSCTKNKCPKYWSLPFICPDKLVETIFQQALQYLGLNRQIHEDNNPNSVEGA